MRANGFLAGCTALAGVGFAALPALAATPLGPATFGNPDQPWGRRRPLTQADRQIVAQSRAAGGQNLASDFKSPGALATGWLPQVDDRSDLKSCREAENVQTSPVGLRLVTLAATHCHAHFSTGSVWSRARYRYGFFETQMKIADEPGVNNAFWLLTNDRFEIDVAEVHYPNEVRITLHNNNNWSPDPSHAVGFDVKFADNLSRAFHAYGLVWRQNDMIFEVDGEPVAAIVTGGAVKGSADIRFSTALGNFGGAIPENPAGHEMVVKSLTVESP